MNFLVKNTDKFDDVVRIAKRLPGFFDQNAIVVIEKESKEGFLYGAFVDDKLIGFAIYKEINPECIEMAWLGIDPDFQNKGFGTKLVEESLSSFSRKYKVCEVKTLSDIDPYVPYKQTREFYKSLQFIPIETIDPYPNWGDNPCQIFVRFLN